METSCYLNIDNHKPFFISDPSSALGSDISAREQVGLRADIRTKCWWGIWYEKGHVMIFLLYTWHKKTFPKRITMWYQLCKVPERGVIYSWTTKVILGWWLLHFIRLKLLYHMVKKKLLLTIIIPYDIYKYNYVNAISVANLFWRSTTVTI
jgi:hypothetical protein